MQTVQTNLKLSPDVIGTGFAQVRQFVAVGRGYRNGSNFEPTSIIVVTIEDEKFSPLTYPQVQGIAENSLRNDLQQHFGNYIFNIELFHLSPLPVVQECTVFVSAYAYTTHHRIRISKTFPVRLTNNWEAVMDSILDVIEVDAQRELSNFGALDGYGVDWLTFTVLGA